MFPWPPTRAVSSPSAPWPFHAPVLDLASVLMSRLVVPLAQWSASDVLALIDEGIEEGQRLEYKRELHLGKPKEHREAAKDVSGMANAQGGLLIYGVEEEVLEDGRRVPRAATPLTDGGVQARLEDVLYTTVTPRLNFESRLLETDGGYFLVVRAFQRGGVPHMVDAYQDKRCYVRTGLSTRPMEQHELEAAYRAVVQRDAGVARRLRHLPLIPRLEGLDLPPPKVHRSEGPWVSVVTLALDAPDPLFEMREADPHAFRDDGDYERWGRESIVSLGLNWDAHGYMDESFGHGLTERVRLYRSGAFEWGRSFPRDEPVPSVVLARKVHDALGYFATSYRRAGYFGRVSIWVSIDGAGGTELGVAHAHRHSSFDAPTLGVGHLEWTGDTNVERLRHDLSSVVHAAMDRIWVAYGFARSEMFDEEGNFTP